MAAAEVGDDVYGEDPTVQALEERVADIVRARGGAVHRHRLDGQPAGGALGGAGRHRPALRGRRARGPRRARLARRAVRGHDPHLEASARAGRPRGAGDAGRPRPRAVPRAHRGGVGGEHAQLRWGVGATDVVAARGTGARRPARRRPAPRRGADLERPRGHRHCPARLRHPRGRHGRLPVQGPRRAGRVAAGRLRRRGGRGPGVAQAAGRGMAAGRCPRGRRAARARPPHRPAGRRPRQCPAAGGGLRGRPRRRSTPTSWSCRAPTRRRSLPRRPPTGYASPRSEPERCDW